MKKLCIAFIIGMIFSLIGSSAFAISYCLDFLEGGNPGGMTTGLKTCDTDNPVAVTAGDTFAVDVWASDVPEALLSSGFMMQFNPTQLKITNVQAYDGIDITGPWNGCATFTSPDAYGPGSYMVALLQLDCAELDEGGDVVLAKVIFQCLAVGSADITVQPIPADGFETTVGCVTGINYDSAMGAGILTVTQGASATEYCLDFLEGGNPGGMTTGLKTCDAVNPLAVAIGDTFSVDVWASDVPESLLSGGFMMEYNPSQLRITNMQAYDGVDITGPWDGYSTFKGPDASGPGSYMVALLQLACAELDEGGDVVLAKATFQRLAAGSSDITVEPVPLEGFETIVGCDSGTNYDPAMNAGILAITQAGGCTDPCSDGNACTANDVCIGDTCTGTPINCDDGRFCNGSESCDPIDGCQAGTPITCPDDEQFCNGNEFCDETTDSCISSGNPCAPQETCYEEVDHCWMGCIADDDCDGICNPGELYPPGCSGSDNCPTTPNPNQEDSYPPQGNGCGDACDCEGNFDADLNQDGSDAFTFKANFGRSSIKNPCTALNHCSGDFSCDGDVDGTDASLFKLDFGRGQFNNPCPVCAVGAEWCMY
jgi:hypothetical protein